MPATIGSLLIDLRADLVKLRESMGSAQEVVASSLEKIEDQASELGKKLVAAFAIERLFEFGKATLEAADEVGRLSQRTGVGVETLTALGHAAKIGGASMEDVANALKTVSEKQVLAAEGSKRAQRGFDALGVSAKDASGHLKDNQQLLLEVADKFQKMQDGPAKAGIAMQLFGDAGVKLIPMLNEGREGIAGLTQEAKDLGLVMSDETAQGAVTVHDNLVKLQGAVQGVANEVLANLTPALVKMTGDMATATAGGKDLAKGISYAVDVVLTLIKSLSTVIQQATTGLFALGSALVSVVKGRFSEAKDTLKDFGGWYVQSVQGWVDDMYALWTGKGTEGPKKAGDEGKKAIANIVDPTAAERAKKIATDIATNLAKAAELSAKQTASQVDDINARYEAEANALQRRLDKEKLTAAQIEAIQARLTALRGVWFKEVTDKQEEEERRAQRNQTDFALQNQALRAKMTKTETDDIAAEYDARIEMLKRKFEDEKNVAGGITAAQYAEQRGLLEAERQQAISAKASEEADKAGNKLKFLAGDLSATFARLLFAPLEKGFKGVSTLVDILGASLKQLAAQLAEKAFLLGLKVLLGGSLGPAGFLGTLFAATGGFLMGPGTSTSDSIPVMASAGEFIVRADAVRNVGLPFLHALNGLTAAPQAGRAFAAGGLVGGSSAAQGGDVHTHMSVVVQGNADLQTVHEIERLVRKMAVEKVGVMGPAFATLVPGVAQR